jgi:hypothetical protein
MKLPVRSALLWGFVAAIPLELANFWLAMPPIDVGFAASPRWYEYLMAGEWVILHLPGLLVSGWFEQRGFGRYDAFLLFASGYLDTALLIALSIVCFRFTRRIIRRRSRKLAAQQEG